MFAISLLLTCGLFCVGPVSNVLAQQFDFDQAAYDAFREANAGLSASGLMAMYPSGIFERRAPGSFAAALHSADIQTAYALTDTELSLIDKHGFVVSERLTNDAFGYAMHDVYAKHLPVFISTDAILHALHKSYNDILQETEEIILFGKLDALLAGMRSAIPTLETQYTGVDGVQTPLRDLDVYINVAQRLLKGEMVAPVFPENEPTIAQIMGYVAAQEGFVEEPMFSEKCRAYDYSQFTPRGHYTKSEELTRYFQSMMWLGRTEIYLSMPLTARCKPTEADVQRQAILALLMAEAVEAGDVADELEAMDVLIQLYVGESDNVTYEHLNILRTITGVNQASELADTTKFRAFQDSLFTQAWSMQRIQSQMLVSGNISAGGRTQPASAFLLFGQRFVIDSYVTGQVVFDKLSSGARRMLPNPLDVLFALGNDAAAQFLEPELNGFDYAEDLAALRYIVESYEDEFWDATIYTGWLNAIRALNPPAEEERSDLPAFMQTAAWWQEKMNTQLAGWAQLRHDNLLYAKQSYSGIPLCGFPFSYVEPIPAFYQAASRLGQNAAAGFRQINIEQTQFADQVIDYFETFAGVNDTLAVIAQKELDGEPVTEEEADFLRRVIVDVPEGCYIELRGWYTKLFYAGQVSATDRDLVVADIHTASHDENGALAGWVYHVGTGPLNMAVVRAEVPEVGEVAFVGPVLSYYQHVSSNFERLTDEVWETAYAEAPSFRPPFVDLYLADQDGNARPESVTLAVNVEDPFGQNQLPSEVTPKLLNYPNPFSAATNITFSVPLDFTNQQTTIEIFDIQGRVVDQIVNEPLPAGNYTLRWNGRRDTGSRLASGTYFVRLRIGEEEVLRPISFIR